MGEEAAAKSPLRVVFPAIPAEPLPGEGFEPRPSVYKT
jgi:hypothetical protein